MASVRDVEKLFEHQDVAGISRALQDRDPLTRRRAAQALGALGQPAGVKALAAALQKDKDPYVIQWAVDSLRQIGDVSAVEALLATIYGPRRETGSIASQALGLVDTAEGRLAAQIVDGLHHNDFSILDEADEKAAKFLNIIIHSDQFPRWPSGKQKQIMTNGVRLGVSPPSKFKKELTEMGVFVSGLHTVGDLLSGLNHRSQTVRRAAAERLGQTGQKWTRSALYNRFQKETRSSGDRAVAVALAGALEMLGDKRGARYFEQQLRQPDPHIASEASRSLGEIGTPEAITALFRFLAEPAPPPAYHNASQIINALINAGPQVIEMLTPFRADESPAARTALANVMGRFVHPEAVSLLANLCTDPDKNVQKAAVEALAQHNTSLAAETLLVLAQYCPRELVLHGLTQMTHAKSVECAMTLASQCVGLYGIVTDDNLRPIPEAQVNLVTEQSERERSRGAWEPLSGRAETDAEGKFWLATASLPPDQPVYLKLTLPNRGEKRSSETLTAEVKLREGCSHEVRVWIDRFTIKAIIDLRDVISRDEMLANSQIVSQE